LWALIFECPILCNNTKYFSIIAIFGSLPSIFPDLTGICPILETLIYRTGFDLPAQSVGGMTIDIHVDDKAQNLIFIANNTTGITSATYHRGSDIERNPNQTTPMGNMNQVYIWKEAISEDAYFRSLIKTY
jgi:hypothetical protein